MDPGATIWYTKAVAAGEHVECGNQSSIEGSVHSNNEAIVNPGCTITGDLSAVGKIVSHGAIEGATTPGAPSQPLPSMPDEASLGARATRTIEGDTTLDNPVINDVLFVHGTARITGGVQGTGTLIATGDIRFENHPADTATALDPALRISLIAENDIWIGNGWKLRAALRAGRDLELRQGVELEGVAIASRQARILEQVTVQFFDFDQAPPTIGSLQPSAGEVVGLARPEIGASYSDDLSGVDLSAVRLVLDGQDVTTQATVTAAGVSFLPSPDLTAGAHAATLTLRDHSGKPAQASWGFHVDLAPPTLELDTPGERTFVHDPSFVIHGTARDDDQLSSVMVNGLAITMNGDAFAVPLTLIDGPNPVSVVASDGFGRQAAAIGVAILDRTPPRITLESPSDGQLVNIDSVGVSGAVADDYGIESFAVAGGPVSLDSGRFAVTVPLSQGGNGILIKAVDEAGNETDQTVTVTRFSLPDVTITAPTDLAYLATTTIDVTGSVSAGSTVSVNGIAAAVSGTTFTANGVPLIEGGNTVTATATDANGHVATATVQVVRDLTPPHVAVYYPAAGSTVYDSPVDVSGLVNDIVPGTVNAAQAQVTVNGRPAAVANRSFLAAGIPLVPGLNVLEVVATDASGNRAEAKVSVTVAAAHVPLVTVVSGAGQTGAIGKVLPQPLVVEVKDTAGNPIVNQQVVFKVTTGDGVFATGKRLIAVPTDASGRAQAAFTLGNHAGVAAQVVEASVAGFAGPATFVETATPGAPALIVVDAGSLQVGVAGRQLPRPLVAAVVDAGSNRLPGVPVVFRVLKGGGRFTNGATALTATTDGDGRAITTLKLGPNEGIANNVVEARIGGQSGGTFAAFVASGRAAGDPLATSVSGVVLDNSNQPIAGVTMRVKDTNLSTTTDAQGQFKIDRVPVGAIKLIADGSTAQRSGTWPDLEYDIVTIAGRDTTVNMPVYLLPIDLASGVYVDETHGATLKLPNFPGFALDIAPGSVIFPNGSRTGVVSATIVHNDKVPMTPNFGQQPKLIVTIQPAGARFDPPAKLTLPNVDGFSAGHVTEMYSFDHDLGHFVSIGPATVSNDALTVTSNPGVGIVKAGWHCSGDPNATGAGDQCRTCTKCDGTACIPDSDQDGRECSPAADDLSGGLPVLFQPGACSRGQCACPRIVNFAQRLPCQPQSDKSLNCEYQYDSSTGNLQDLDTARCEIYEHVEYPSDSSRNFPDPQNPAQIDYVWPNPPWVFVTSSPTINSVPIFYRFGHGWFQDNQGPGAYDPRGFGPASFVAEQYYYLHCPCRATDQTIDGPNFLIRSVNGKPSTGFSYQIEKNADSRSLELALEGWPVCHSRPGRLF